MFIHAMDNLCIHDYLCQWVSDFLEKNLIINEFGQKHKGRRGRPDSEPSLSPCCSDNKELSATVKR